MENINKYFKFKTYRIQTIFSKLIMFHCYKYTLINVVHSVNHSNLKLDVFLFYLGREILITLYVCV